MMKNKMMLAALAALMVLTLLGGCQLAIPEDATGEGTPVGSDTLWPTEPYNGTAEETSASSDALCGIFITLVSLKISEAEFSYPEPRLYATQTEYENGAVDYVFGNVAGFRMFSVKHGEGDEAYNMMVADDPIWPIDVSYSNNGDLCLTGTICLDVHAECVLFINPVYQSPDGEIYTTRYEVMGFGSDGVGGSTTYSSTNTETVSGETVTNTNEVTIHITRSNTVQQAVLKQMDKNDQMISQDVITQDSIPESIGLLSETA